MKDIVTKKELRQATGVCKTTLLKYLSIMGIQGPVPRERYEEVVTFVKDSVKKSLSERSARCSEMGKDTSVRRGRKKAVHCWRVVVKGAQGWFVVRCGLYKDMEAWANVFQINGFEAEVRKNERGSR